MLTNWKSHCWQGPCQFERTDETFIIKNDASNCRGGWICYADEAICPGDQFLLNGSYQLGYISAIWYHDKEYISGQHIEPGEPFAAPEDKDVNRIRVDLRLWGQEGIATFSEISLERYTPEPEPEPELDLFLQVPPPDTTQKHHVTGWKWGRNIALMVHDLPEDSELAAADTPPTYIDQNEDIIPYEVKGWQHGRHLDLEIGNMFFTDEEE